MAEIEQKSPKNRKRTKIFAGFLFGLLFVLSFGYFGGQVYLYELRYHPNRTHLRLNAEVIENYNKGEKAMPKNIIIGDSRSASLRPKWIQEMGGGEVYNFSVGGGDIFYAYYVLERLLEQNAEIENVYIQLSEGNEGNLSTVGTYTQLLVRHFFNSDEVEELEQHIKGTKKYYDTSRFMEKRYFQTSNINAIKKNKWKVLEPKINNKMLKDTLREEKGFFVNAKNLQTNLLEDGREIYDFSHIGSGIKEDSVRKFGERAGVSEASFTYIDKMIKLAESEDIEIKFFLSPIAKSRKEQMPKSLGFGGMMEWIGYVPASNFEEKIAIFPNNYFYDWTHTDYKGSKAYSDYFVNIVMKGESGYESGDLHTLSTKFVPKSERKHSKMSRVNFWDE